MRTIFCILWLITLMSCDGSEKIRVNYITITGIVTDQTSNQPVEGATVSCGVQRGAMPGNTIVSIGATTLTGTDGRYSISSRSESVNDLSSVALGQRGLSIAILANKDGYAGSDRFEIYYYNAKDQIINIPLYRKASLNLNIKNDTLNSIDSVEVELYKNSSYNPIRVFDTICKGIKLDTTYVIDNLYGNCNYTLQMINEVKTTKYTLTPKPDEINNFEIVF